MKLIRKISGAETGIACLAAALYVLISLVNHFLYRTYYNDLGLYTNAMYNYAHGNWDRSLIIHGGEHVDLWLVIFSPLSFLFGSYTLLLIQITCILAGGFGIFRYLLLVSANKTVALLGQVHFYFSFGILTALSFDYHSNVCAAMLVPWLFVFLREEKWVRSSIVFLLILLAKENMSLWMVFVCSGLLFGVIQRKRNASNSFRMFGISEDRKNSAKLLAAYMVVSAGYFIFLTQWFMPAYSFAVIGHLRDYHLLGNSPSSAVMNFLSHPVRILSAFFVNHANDVRGDFLKAEFHILLLFSGGWILLFRPRYLWMCLPLFAQKMLTDNPQFWGLGGQYAIEFVPIITIGLFEFIAIHSFAGLKKWVALGYVSVLSSMAASFRVMDKTQAFIDHSAIRFYQARHYSPLVQLAAAAESLRHIPSDAALSAQTHFTPHVALRKSLSMFPDIGDAAYILLQLNGHSFYPLTKQELLHQKDSLIQSSQWEEIWQRDSIFILQRNK